MTAPTEQAQEGGLRGRLRTAHPGPSLPQGLRLELDWEGDVCRPGLRNESDRPIGLPEIVLLDVEHGLGGDVPFYGEGFQMLAQTGGTVALPERIGSFPDAEHYRLSFTPDMSSTYGMVVFTPGSHDHELVAFSSCHRFSGMFRVDDTRLQVVVETEGLVISPGEHWLLEEVMVIRSDSWSSVTSQLAARIEHNHPLRITDSIPTGWCSWQSFADEVTESDILANADRMQDAIPELREVLIDDGYQAAWGDWLQQGPRFPEGMEALCTGIRERGLEPAVWVAPFVAEEGSQVLAEHPEWFVQDGHGAPLRSDSVTFGGWAHAPWYVIDGTHPGAQQHLAHVFAEMRSRWGVRSFKLDANMWGAIHGGTFHDPSATRVEAYRRGMAAICRGAGDDAYILGCNAPMWASLGLVNAMRVGNDVYRSWAVLGPMAREVLNRTWQHGRLWAIDPDSVLLQARDGVAVDPGGVGHAEVKRLTEDEFMFGATVVHAAGGLLHAGDSLTELLPENVAILRRLAHPTGTAAAFEDRTLRVGCADAAGRRYVYLFNWEDTPRTLAFAVPDSGLVDFWTDEPLRDRPGPASRVLRPHSARLLVTP